MATASPPRPTRSLDPSDPPSMSGRPAFSLAPAARAAFDARGVALLPGLLTAGEVDVLREECASLIAAAAAADAAAGADDDNPAACILRRGCILDTLPAGTLGAAAAARGDAAAAAAARAAPPLSPAGAALALRSRVVETARALLGGPPVLSLVGEQFIIKPPHTPTSSAFAPHADADALPGGRASPDAAAYVSIWVPLDACDVKSGGLTVGGVALTLPAGTGVAMRGDAVHESPGNGSDKWRRAWMPQYARGEGLAAGWRVVL